MDKIINDINEKRFAPGLIAERLARARGEISSAGAHSVGAHSIGTHSPNIKERGGGGVKLLAVTKTVPAEIINYAIDSLGITAIGENRVQELLEKYGKLHSPKDGKLEIHLIGNLQTNKVKYIIDKVDMIESVDSQKLAAEIDRQAKKAGRTMDILVEVNIGREPQKGGVLPEELYAFLGSLAGFSSLRLRGLMTVAPKCTSSEDYMKYFSETYHYFIDISHNNLHNIYEGETLIDISAFDVLSMGMSDSFREAVKCGATEVRLGSAVFGERA